MSRTQSRIRLAHVVLGSLLLISFGHALSRHVFDLGRPRGVVALVLVAVTAALALAAPSIRRPSYRTIGVAVGATCAVALQVVAPDGSLALLLYIAAAGVGATTPRRWVWVAIGGSVAVVAALSVVTGSLGSVSDMATGAFSIAVSIGLTNTLVHLRRTRDERERLYAELSTAHEELRRRALHAEELAELRERSRLARELHDTLGHALTTLTVQLEAIERTARARPASLPPLLEDARGLSRRAMAELRESLGDLRGDPASRTLAERLRAPAEAAAARAGWKLNLALEGVDVAPEAEHALVRIAREALSNAERHAGAHHVTLALRSVAERIELFVADDGTGFDPGAVGGSRFGLRGMRERAALLGATLEVRSGPGLGTEVLLSTPTAAPRPEAAAT